MEERKLILYLASSPSKDNLEMVNRVGGNILLSFFYLKKYDLSKLKQDYPNIKKVFVDSGAFSAYNIGAKIDMEKYVEYLLKYKDYYDIAAGLDVIGDPEKTYEQCLYMKSRGCKILPTLHFGDNISWLEKYRKDWDYIALGGMGGGFVDKAKIIRWFDVIFSKYPGMKFHGFAITSDELLKRYPFQSIDSASWMIKSVMGQVYSKTIGEVISVGRTNNDIKKMLDGEKQKWFDDFIRCGTTYQELFDDRTKRVYYNALNYTMWNDAVITWKPVQNQLTSFFDTGEVENTTTSVQEYKNEMRERVMEWVVMNYKDVDELTAIKLICHQFDMTPEQVKMDIYGEY